MIQLPERFYNIRGQIVKAIDYKDNTFNVKLVSIIGVICLFEYEKTSSGKNDIELPKEDKKKQFLQKRFLIKTTQKNKKTTTMPYHQVINH